MAGIGFALREHLRDGTWAGVVRAYGLAAVANSGPWVLSIVGTMAIGLLAMNRVPDQAELTLFLASVTHVTAASLVFSGGLQLALTRFVSDRIFEKRMQHVRPNAVGALAVLVVASGTVGTLLALFAIHGPAGYRIAMVAAFVTLNAIWLLSALLASSKEYKIVVGLFALGYAIAVVWSAALARYGALGLLAGFVLGHAVLMFGMLMAVLRTFPSEKPPAFRFLRPEPALVTLAVTGLLYHFGVWIDKVIFWWHPATSVQVNGVIRVSLVYDIPVFLAYLSIIPGMAVFLLSIETDFAERYDELFSCIRGGGTLQQIEGARDAMVSSAREGLYDIFRVQGLTVAVLMTLGPVLFERIGLPLPYLRLFNVDIVGAAAQVILLAVLTILFYLDYRAVALSLCALFASSNTILTLATHALGPRFYGYGFAVAAALTSLLGLGVLIRKLDRLEYGLFMR